LGPDRAAVPVISETALARLLIGFGILEAQQYMLKCPVTVGAFDRNKAHTVIGYTDSQNLVCYHNEFSTSAIGEQAKCTGFA